MLVDRALRQVGQRFQFSMRWDHAMQIHRGIAASPGEAMIMDHEGFRIPRRFVVDDAVNDEWRRLKVAMEEVGLYRTEFLYLASNQEPTEEEHYQAYAHVVRSVKQRPVVIRTLDLGADKTGQIPRGEEERNPFLGLGSIRLARQNLPLFRVQLRAILRASSLGPV